MANNYNNTVSSNPSMTRALFSKMSGSPGTSGSRTSTAPYTPPAPVTNRPPGTPNQNVLANIANRGSQRPPTTPLFSPPKTSNPAAVVASQPQTTPPSQPTSPATTTTPPVTTPPTQPTTPSNPGTSPTNGLYGQIVNNLANVGTDDVTGATKNISDLQKDYANQAAGLQSEGLDIGYGTGASNILQNNYNTRLSAAELGLQNALTARGQQIGALGNAGSLAAPQPYGLTTQPYNPVTDTYGGGGTGGAINRSIQASNIGSAQDFQSKINDIQAKAPAADAAFSVLSSYAGQVGGGNIPILQGLQKLYGSTAQGNTAVAGFQAQLQAVRDAWQAIEGGDPTSAIPDNITAQQLTQIQQQLKTDSQNKITGYQNQLSQLQSGGNNNSNNQTTSTPSGNSTFGGDAWK
jgi:hypothetical protein